MSLTDTLNTMVTSVTGKALNRYRLDIPSCTADIDVEDFSGSEAMSELYSYTINFTSADKNIDARQMLSKPATLTMGAGDLLSLTERKVVHGGGVSTPLDGKGSAQGIYQTWKLLPP